MASVCLACSTTTVVERKIIPHTLSGCPLGGDPVVTVTALGDFGALRSQVVLSAKSASTIDLPNDLVGAALQSSAPPWAGVGYADPPAEVDLTFWPSDRACETTSATIPPSRGGRAMTPFAGGTRFFVAGLLPLLPNGASDAAHALVLDLSTGKTVPSLDTGGISFGTRAFASATPFGDGVLLAGGIDPTDASDVAGDHPLDGAVVFSGNGFDPMPLSLGRGARSRHGAVTLATGETLLVGGKGSGSGLLSTMVAIDPVSRTTRFYRLGALARPRLDPTVLRLANDEILVAGGTDASGGPVSTLEWFAADGSACTPSTCSNTMQEIPPRQSRAFSRLSWGGALAVGGFDPDTNALSDDVYWIRLSGPPVKLMPISDRGSDRFRLVDASDGAPWLWNGQKWLRFDPWQAAFTTPDRAPTDGPETDMPDPVAIDPGLFVWLARAAPGDASSPLLLQGFRHGVRGPYARDTTFVLSEPLHLVPDRPPDADVSPAADGLHLANGAGATIADTTYGDFVLRGQTKSAGLPAIELAPGFLIGPAGACTWPPDPRDVPANRAFSVTRVGAEIDVVIDGVAAHCSGPSGRTSIGLRAPTATPVVVRELEVKRGNGP